MVQLQQFAPYEIVRKLGRGMTDVYLAFDPAMQRQVVLKLIEVARDDLTQLMIEAERRGAQIQKQLHKLDSRFLEIYDFGERNGCFFVAMEYLDGRNIAEILQRERRFEPDRACRCALEVLSQLHRLHSFVSEMEGKQCAVVHGDIKPSNIQIGVNGEVRLLDFGIAKVITHTHNLTHHNLGSPTYCSPERLTKAQVDPQADLWAMGVSLYEMVAGSPPYQAQSTRKLETLIQSRRPPRALPADCPPALRAIILKALAGDLTRRYASASAMESDLRAFLERRPTVAEFEKLPAWDTNVTIEKTPNTAEPQPGRTPPWKLAAAKLGSLPRVVPNIVWTTTAGFLAGLALFLPLAYYLRFREESRPIRVNLNFVHLNAREVESNWRLYEELESENQFLGRYSPALALREPFHAHLVAVADDVIERYRNSSEPGFHAFDWSTARLSLNYALAISPEDREARGKLALCDGYINLIRNPKLPRAAESEANFLLAASLLGRSPDPHLGLARLYTYAFRNGGKAAAALTQAERLGYHPGPREIEQRADAFLYRAEYELRQAQRALAYSKKEQERWLFQARDDLERARALYEPIEGYSNVSSSLDKLHTYRLREEQLRAAAKQPARGKPRPTARRSQFTSSLWR